MPTLKPAGDRCLLTFAANEAKEINETWIEEHINAHYGAVEWRVCRKVEFEIEISEPCEGRTFDV